MSIRVCVEDTSLDLAITLSVGGGYNTDCVDDLCNRAISLYREALGLKVSIGQPAESESAAGEVDDA